MDEAKGTVLIAGGRGFIGRHLHSFLKQAGWTVKILTRSAETADGKTLFHWDPARQIIDERLADTPITAVVNLAGKNIGGGRWTRRFKETLYRSRIDATRLLVEHACRWRLKVFVQITGIGYYGYDRGEEWLPETAHPGDDFLARLSIDWEKAARPVEGSAPLFIFRTGVVLGRDGGMIAKLRPPALLNLLSPLGSGRQWMSWIHIDDLVRVIHWAITHPTQADLYNAASPHPVRNKTFTYHLASSLNKAIFLPNAPRWALRLAVGEMERALTGSLRVDARKLHAHLSFQYPKIEEALQSLSLVRH